MKDKFITGVFYNPVEGIPRMVTIPNNLQSFYELLNVNVIDIVEYKIEGQYYDIIVDDEGLLKEGTLPSASTINGSVMLFGPIFICRSDKQGNECSIKEGELEKIKVINITDPPLILIEP